MEQNQCTSCARPIPAGVAQCPHCGAMLAPATPAYPSAPHRGGTILALGIVGLICCAPVGIAAWVMGNQDLSEMAAGRMNRAGEGMTQAGKICGIIAVVLWAAGFIVGMIMMALGMAVPFMQ
jgi:hypothetical protein